MTEHYNFPERRNEISCFNSLLLSHSEIKLLTGSEDFDSRDMTVRLEINGIDVCIKDFNEVLGSWGDRVYRDIKESLDYLSQEEAVLDKAEVLFKEKLSEAYSVLQEIQDMGDRLGD